jgi:hypothetical protein
MSFFGQLGLHETTRQITRTKARRHRDMDYRSIQDSDRMGETVGPAGTAVFVGTTVHCRRNTWLSTHSRFLDDTPRHCLGSVGLATSWQGFNGTSGQTKVIGVSRQNADAVVLENSKNAALEVTSTKLIGIGIDLNH